MLEPQAVLRETLLGMSRSTPMRKVIENAPIARGVVQRFTAGETIDHVVGISHDLHEAGMMSTIDYLGEDTVEVAQAEHTRDQYLRLIEALAAAGLTEGGTAEVSIKLTAIGLTLPDGGEQLALDNARAIARAAVNAGTTATIDMEDHTVTDATLDIVRDIRKDLPTTGGVLQSYLYRTEDDCRDLAYAGSRIRICKGTYKEPATVAYPEKHDVDLSYVRCLKVLMEGEGYPMVATHDPQMIEIARALSHKAGRAPESFEYQMLYGIRPELQKRIVAGGERLRVYLPFGEEWYGYLMRRMAERPANLAFFLRSLNPTG